MNSFSKLPPESENSAPAIITWRLIVALVLLLLLSLQLRAQDSYPQTKIGIRAGVNLNSWTNEFPVYQYEGQTFVPDDWKASVGLHAGVNFNIRLSSLVAIEPAVIYTQKGTSIIAEDGGVSGEATIQSSYVDIPVLVRLYVANGFNLFAGPQMAYQFSSKFDATAGGTKVVNGQDITDSISELDIMLVLGAGYEFEEGFTINLSGEFGFGSVDGFEVLDTYNRTIRLSLGYNF